MGLLKLIKTTAKATSTASLESARTMMHGIRRYAKRLGKKGKLMTNGWMILKQHNLIYIIKQIQNFGPARLAFVFPNATKDDIHSTQVLSQGTVVSYAYL